MKSASCNFSWPTKCAVWPTKLQSVWPFGQLSKIIIFNSAVMCFILPVIFFQCEKMKIVNCLHNVMCFVARSDDLGTNKNSLKCPEGCVASYIQEHLIPISIGVETTACIS